MVQVQSGTEQAVSSPVLNALVILFVHQTLVLGLIEYSMDKSNADKAIAIFDEALKIDPNFVLAAENKKGLLAKKKENTK